MNSQWGGGGSGLTRSKDMLTDDPRDKTYKGGANRKQSAEPPKTYNLDADGHELIRESDDSEPQPVSSVVVSFNQAYTYSLLLDIATSCKTQASSA